MLITDPIFTTVTLAWRILVKNSSTEFHENSIDGLVAKTRSQRESDVVSTWSFYFTLWRAPEK